MTEEKSKAQGTAYPALLKLIEKDEAEKEILKTFRQVFYEKDDKLADLRAIVLEFHIVLETLLDDVITENIFGKENSLPTLNAKGRYFLDQFVLEKITFSDKVQILRKTKKYEKGILNKIDEINSLRNSLAHIRKRPKKLTKEIIEDKRLLRNVANDVIKIFQYFRPTPSDAIKSSLIKQSQH